MTNFHLPFTAVFWANGIPRPKQSFKVSGKGGGYTPARIKAWQDSVLIAAKNHLPEEPFNTKQYNFDVTITFFLPDRAARDLDNLSKAVLDALSGHMWSDDKGVANLNLRKRYRTGNPGAAIQVLITEGAWHELDIA